LSACANVSLRAKEWKGELVFLHEVAPGAADRSYGVQVARLAGLPRAAVDRARTVLSRLEAGARARGPIAQDTLPLFDSSAQAASHSASPPSAVEEALRALDLDGLTPREAADALYRLKALLRS
jgi:DNA mismatch repair protein MutS